jgi:hypothetical protein
MKDNLILKKNDDGSWIINDALKGMENVLSTKDMMMALKYMMTAIDDAEAKKAEADPYTTGYNDGQNNRQNSLYWNKDDAYMMGWEDGKGDKTYE